MAVKVDKDKILSAWIAAEHIVEGDYTNKSIGGRKPVCLHSNKDEKECGETNYYGLIQSKLELLKNPDKGGVILYLGVFELEELLKAMRAKYNKAEVEELKLPDRKFSLSLCFDNNLELDPKSIFYTGSAFLKDKYLGSETKTFSECERRIIEYVEQAFDYKEALNNGSGWGKDELFNRALNSVLGEYGFAASDCYFRIVKNRQLDIANMHSFFVSDLETARKVDTGNLNLYLYGFEGTKEGGRKEDRVNLDSDKDSDACNADVFKMILRRDNYPLGRFPSNPKYALSFMQQVAVNLAIGVDKQQMRSVNGPPGTGKTTLLKDIFAELVVRQAKYLCELKSKNGGKLQSIVFDETISLEALPDEITDNEIIVASSNNGAVQNIVNELPLVSGIYGDFVESLMDVDYFSKIANQSEQNDDSSEVKFWGVFSLEGGKSSNMTILTNKVGAIADYLSEPTYNSNPSIYDNFMNQYDSVKQKKLGEKYKKNTVREDLSDKEGPLKRLFHRVFSSDKPDKLSTLDNDSVSKDESINKNNLDSDDLVVKKGPFEEELTYDQLQQKDFWFDEAFRIQQSELFIEALRVRKEFLFEHRGQLKKAVDIWNYQSRYIKKKEIIEAAYHWLNFAIPVISSTFASFSNMCRNLGPNTLGHLFVDEAGQAVPQAAVGAIYRSRNVMVVGDPAQIKPVLTLDPNIIAEIHDSFGISGKYLSENASVQSLVDDASRYGYYKKSDEGDTGNPWIGIPLWVHRRCKDPMFLISNRISYGGMMVQGNPGDGKLGWFDVGGTATNKYVKEQGEFLVEKIREEINKNGPEFVNRVYIISPFTHVVDELKALLYSKQSELNFLKFSDSGKATNIGTIHTFQGKENDIVFMVLGADESSQGAAKWSVAEPNMMNVAATRAKKEFYIIGDRKLYEGLNNKVIKGVISVIDDYKKEHPENVLGQKLSRIDNVEEKRLKGKITRVGRGRKAIYAYIDGDDGVQYALSENEYPNVENASDIIQQEKRISFVIDDQQKKGKNVYIKDVLPVD